MYQDVTLDPSIEPMKSILQLITENNALRVENEALKVQLSKNAHATHALLVREKTREIESQMRSEIKASKPGKLVTSVYYDGHHPSHRILPRATNEDRVFCEACGTLEQSGELHLLLQPCHSAGRHLCPQPDTWDGLSKDTRYAYNLQAAAARVYADRGSPFGLWDHLDLFSKKDYECAVIQCGTEVVRQVDLPEAVWR